MNNCTLKHYIIPLKGILQIILGVRMPLKVLITILGLKDLGMFKVQHSGPNPPIKDFGNPRKKKKP